MGGGAWVGYTFQGFKSESFSNFIKTYNEINSATLKEGFGEKFKPLHGWGWNLTYYISDGFDFRGNTGVSYLKSVNKAEYLNGDIRKLGFSFHDWTVDCGLGGGGEGFFINFNFGMNLRMSKLYASYVFANGFESFASDHKLNGVYTAWRLTGLLGGTIGIPFSENVQLVFRADYVFPANGDDTYKASYSDLTEFKESNDMFFPQDLYQYVNDPFDLFNNAYNDVSGIRYTLALQFVFGD